MDKARKQTDKKLMNLERRISAIYANDPSLLRIQKQYAKYMKQVEKKTRPLYKAYKKASDEDRVEAKQAYADAVQRMTLENTQYKRMIAEFTMIMADVNQKALDLVNAEMPEIYMMNYNAVADECERVGIDVED